MATIAFSTMPRPEIVGQIYSILSARLFSLALVSDRKWMIVDSETGQQLDIPPELANVLKEKLDGFAEISN